MSLQLLGFFGLFLPSGSDGLPLSEELNSALAVEVAYTSEATLASGEGEHRKRHWNGKVNSDLSGINFMLELSSSVAILGKDCSTVAIVVAVNQVKSFLEVVSSDNYQNRPKDFLVIY